MTCPSKRYFINKVLNAEEQKKSPNSKFWKPKIVEYVQLIRDNVPPRQENTDGGLYVGTPGIAYLFYCLMKSPLMESQKKEYGSKGLEYICTAEQYVVKRKPNDFTEVYGFLLGKAGLHAVAAALYWVNGSKKKSEEHMLEYANLNPYSNYSVSYGGNELFVGRAGYLLGAIWLEKELQRQVLTTCQINDTCRLIIEDGRCYAQAHHSPSPLMYAYYDTEYIGAAHGLSSILFVLLHCNDFLEKNPEAERDVKSATDYILCLQTPSGNFPCATEDIGFEMKPEDDYELVHWCHGAPGIVYLMAKAYLRWKDEKYLDSCIKCGENVWEKGLLKKGPGLCHGVSGNGYVFLLLYRLTGEEKYVHRATVFAEFMLSPEFRKNARTPDCPYSLYEGLAGALCFLLDLHTPSQSAFPFMDVF